MLSETPHNDSQRYRRLVVISNRLPITLTKEYDAEIKLIPASGGLVNALLPILRERRGLWVGWPGIPSEVGLENLLIVANEELGFELKPVSLTTKDYHYYYLGFSNEVLWPLLHNFPTRCNFEPIYWKAYQSVNRKFAETIAKSAKSGDYIWVHDYHLLMVAEELRRIGISQKIGLFMHTPFPPRDTFTILPWNLQIVRSLLQYDTIGFQSLRDRNNFIDYVRAALKGLHFNARKRISIITTERHAVKAGVYPISIDYEEFVNEAADEKVTNHVNLLKQACRDRKIILGIERLDYSKGIPERLKAFQNALGRFSDLIGNVTFIQIVVPSRSDIPEYKDLKYEIQQLVSEINGKYTQPGWVPVHYMFRSLKRSELIAYYRVADIAIVTPLIDGMNLIAKEYCAANIDCKGVLILSQFAGAAEQLGRYSLLVNPYDIEGFADTIYCAYIMDDDERQLRMRKLRKSIKNQDIFWWANSFLAESEIYSTG